MKPLTRKIMKPLMRKIIKPHTRKIMNICRRKIEHLSITRKNTIQYLLCQGINEPFYMNKTLNRTNVEPVENHDSLTSTYDHNPCLYSCRLTARKLRQSNIIRYRAPSRVCFKKIMRAMKNRKCRQKVKQFLKHLTPTSSVLNHIATNYIDLLQVSLSLSYSIGPHYMT